MAISIIKSLGPGEIMAWGDDSLRQFSDLPPGADFEMLATGGASQSLAIKQSGSLALWGGSSNPSSAIPDIPPGALLGPFVAAHVGLSHFVAIGKDGTLTSWGNYLNTSTPPVTGVHAKAVGAGANHDIAILPDGTLKTWGAITTYPAGTFQKVDARSGYCLALRDDGRLYGWGPNLAASSTAWTPDAGFLYIDGPFIDIAAGVVQKLTGQPAIPHVLALRPNGSVLGIGADTFGESTGEPVGVVFTRIAAGMNHSIGLTADGALYHWGNPKAANFHTGGAKPPSGSPGPAAPGPMLSAGPFISITAGSNHVCAVLASHIAVEAGPNADRVTIR
jgi:alpha-tubulin suppressor-like RCC1 family protein